jgi:phage/plasmid-like protein (TIGR03299 family)
MSSEVDTMFFTGADPWHRIGTKLDNPATAAEAISAAGLGWNVEMEPVLVERNGVLIDTKRYATSRSDTGEILHVGFSKQYTPLQNREAFNFFDGIVGAGEAIYHTAGSLKRGRIVWILAKMPGDIGLTGDPADKYIMLSNSHDGSMGVDMRFCVRRVVCMNTLKMAFDENDLNVRLRHTPNIMNKVNQTRDLLGLSNAYFKNFMAGAERLADKQLSKDDAIDYVSKVFDYAPTADHPQSSIKNIIGDIVTLYNGEGRGAELVTANGTAWGAFNAVSEWAEHHRFGQGNDDHISRRLSSSFYGSGAKLEQRAWRQAMALVN